MTPAIGSCVRLRNCPHGEAGIVRGMRCGRVVVDWPDLGDGGRPFRCEHRTKQLQLAADVPETSGFETSAVPINSSAESAVCGTQFHMVFGTEQAWPPAHW